MKSPKFKVSHSARGGRLNPNETLSNSNGKFVFDHGPYYLDMFSSNGNNGAGMMGMLGISKKVFAFIFSDVFRGHRMLGK